MCKNKPKKHMSFGTNAMHSAETCGRTKFLHILNSKKFYTLHVQTRISKKCVHICKNIIKVYTKFYKSRNLVKNRSALGNMANIQTWISTLVKVGSTLSHFSVTACVLHSWQCGCAFLGALGAVALSKISLLGRARINCLEIWPIYYTW